MWSGSPSPPASQWVGAKKPPLIHAIHTSWQAGQPAEGLCWEAAEGTGWQDTCGPAMSTDTTENPLKTPNFPLALTAQPFCVPYPAHRAPLPRTMPLHTNTCLPGPWEQLRYLLPGQPRHAGLCRGKSCPSSLGPVLSMHLSHWALHRAASASLPHKPPALPLLLPAWVPPPLPPLQQISLKCAAIWFQLSPIFFLVD